MGCGLGATRGQVTRHANTFLRARRTVLNISDLRTRLLEGLVIPAHPLALTANRTLDERRQRALTRYYLAAGAGGIAVGVHTTQFAIRDPAIGLLQPVLELASATAGERPDSASIVRVAGVIGETRQAVSEARLALDQGYQVALVSLGGLDGWTVDQLVVHMREIATVLPVMGFYLQPAVGGRDLPYEFWRRLADLDRLVGIKVAPFDREQTLEVVRAVHDAGREGEIALYTGNDDHIVLDLVTVYRFGASSLRFAGGLLGQWALWTRRAVGLLAECRRAAQTGAPSGDLLSVGAQLTEANAAIFDASHAFAGCVPGIHEVLRRQGLLQGIWCLRHDEGLSRGQAKEIDRVLLAYPHLADDEFVRAHLDEWMA